MRNAKAAKRLSFFRSVLERRRTDIAFKMKLSLLPSGAVNIFYVATKFLAGVTSRSFWFISLAVYYALLFSLRFYLLSHIHKNELGKQLDVELKKAKICGVLLFIMGWALSVIVFLMVYLNRGYNYPGLLIYVMGGYSIYSVTTAAVSLFRYRKFGSPVLVTTRVVKLTAALVSFLSLETAMLERLGARVTPAMRRQLIGFTGGGVCLVVIVMAVMMIAYANRSMAGLNREK